MPFMVSGKTWCQHRNKELLWQIALTDFVLHSDIQLKDNPAFSMLNDSDDEVIYRSVVQYCVENSVIQ